MKTCTTALFFIFLLTAFVSADQDNILELVDKSPEGREILDSIYLELNTQGANLDRGKLFQVLKTTKNNASKSEFRQKERLARHKKSCKADKKVLRGHIHANRKSQYTVNRHLQSNTHATNKNQQYINRNKEEFHSYDELSNLITANRAKWNEWHATTNKNLNTVIAALRRSRKILRDAQRIAAGAAFIELQGDSMTALSEIRVEITNTNDELNGLRPIVNSLLQTMSEVPQIGKSQIRRKVIKILRNLIKILQKERDRQENRNEGAQAIYEALLKNMAENKTRCQKLEGRLVSERNVLTKRQVALADALKRARSITKLSKQAFQIRASQCRGSKRRNARLFVKLQKVKNIVAQIEEILQERFGNLKSYFVERRHSEDEFTQLIEKEEKK
jgi:ElaB/YqjD/DUF883 family membrane-anchored ribosome-binding protein